jgi:hypothetical protein
MEALQKMQAAGFRLEAISGQLKVSPANRLNPRQREYLKRHREELLAALDTPPATITRAMLEARHPTQVAGLPLAEVLDDAVPEDYEDLWDYEILECYARALAHYLGKGKQPIK